MSCVFIFRMTKRNGAVTGIWNLELKGNTDPPRVVLDVNILKIFLLEMGRLLGGGGVGKGF